MKFCKKMSETICKYIYCIIASLIVIGVIIYISISGHSSDWTYYFNESFATWSYIAIILSAIFVGWQALLFRKDYKDKKQHSEFEMSYRLARYYAENIIPKLGFCNFFLESINKAADKDYYSKSYQFKEFTRDEAIKIFGNDDKVIKKFSSLFGKPIPENVLLILYAILYKTSRVEIKRKWDEILKESPKEKLEEFYSEKRAEIYSTFTTIMNDIEYFSMYFCSGLAVPDNVYMSLHQTFIKFIVTSYLYICNLNDKPGHEFYAHTIELFNKWQEKSLKEDREREESLKKINNCNLPKKIH